MKKKLYYIGYVLMCLWAIPHAVWAQDESSELEKGLQFCKGGSHTQAVELLDEAFKKYASNPKISFALASCHDHLKNKEEAITYYEETVELKPDHTTAHLRLANLYFGNNQIMAAIKHYDDVFKLSTIRDEKLRSKFKLIMLLSDTSGYIQEASKHLAELKAFIGSVPPKIWHLEGKILYQKKKYEEALQAFSTALKGYSEKDTDAEDLYFWYAMTAQKTKNYEEMGKVYEKISSPHYTKKLSMYGHEYFFNLGYAYFFSYEFEKSNEYLNTALTIKPDYNSARIFMNQIESKNAPKLWAINYTKQQITKTSGQRLEEANYYNDLSRLYLHEKKYTQAVRAADSCLSITPDNLEALFTKGVSYYKQNDNDEAVTTFEDLVRKANQSKTVDDETLARFYFMLGLSYKRVASPRTLDAFEKAKRGIYRDAAENELAVFRK